MPNNQLRLPSHSPQAKLLNALGNSVWLAQTRRFVLSRLPFPTLESDVVDVVYASWVIPAADVHALVPANVPILQANGNTILTVLSYQHGHFGPRFLGPLRKLLPSPLQSNWRLYVTALPDGSTSERVVLFIKNIFSSGLYGLGSRLFSDALPSHVAGQFIHQKTATGYHTQIASGTGSAPSFELSVNVGESRELPEAFKAFFPSWELAVHALTQQDSALTEIAGSPLLAHAGIDLPIDPLSVCPAKASRVDAGAFLAAHGVTGEPFCFVVPQVRFRVLWEKCL